MWMELEANREQVSSYTEPGTQKLLKFLLKKEKNMLSEDYLTLGDGNTMQYTDYMS